jgi:hypothetical protein
MKKDEISVEYGTYGGVENTYRLLVGKIWRKQTTWKAQK